MMECLPYEDSGLIIKIIHKGKIYGSVLPTYRSWYNVNKAIAQYCLTKGYRFYLSSMLCKNYHNNFLTLLDSDEYMQLVQSMVPKAQHPVITHNSYNHLLSIETKSMIDEDGVPTRCPRRPYIYHKHYGPDMEYSAPHIQRLTAFIYSTAFATNDHSRTDDWS